MPIISERLDEHEILLAVVIGIFFAIIFSPVGALFFEMLPANSRIRTAISWIQNKLAARSIAKLRKRIASLEKYRDSLVTERAHYLSTLRFILAMLTLMSVGISVFILGRIELSGRTLLFPGSFDLLALMCLGLATFCGVYALRFASLDTHNKIKAMIAGINADIDELTSKLPHT
ncbi:MAG TPA: hypothetical protein VKW06_17045 [Candidatus Angelobacter sp.]|nr:hypothetical protein [Candidatus Angelobacter sp.]